jgi:hypothetical protein
MAFKYKYFLYFLHFLVTKRWSRLAKCNETVKKSAKSYITSPFYSLNFFSYSSHQVYFTFTVRWFLILKTYINILSSGLCVPTGSGAHPASCTMGTGRPFAGVKRGRGVTLTTHPHLVPRSRKSRSCTSSPTSAYIACSETALAFIRSSYKLPLKIWADFWSQNWYQFIYPEVKKKKKKMMMMMMMMWCCWWQNCIQFQNSLHIYIFYNVLSYLWINEHQNLLKSKSYESSQKQRISPLRYQNCRLYSLRTGIKFSCRPICHSRSALYLFIINFIFN